MNNVLMVVYLSVWHRDYTKNEFQTSLYLTQHLNTTSLFSSLVKKCILLMDVFIETCSVYKAVSQLAVKKCVFILISFLIVLNLSLWHLPFIQ